MSKGQIALLAVIVGLIFGLPWVFMSLWNYLIPIIFVGSAIGSLTYWQAWGFVIMVRILTHNTANSSTS
jgi:hypothetical protein